ncbi:MAG: hypothetical protein PHU06_14250 [Gallionella sp.]|nr:hypothetical protein [Gallionella sp.]MDD4960529.1 hypothetical protein [Gallionella sp.]
MNLLGFTVSLTGTLFTELQTYYIHSDHLDSPRSITNTAGQEVWRWDNTDPFGNNIANENPANQGAFTFNLRFPGQYFDRETGLHYNVNRDYNPATGRYVQSDPIGLMGGINTFGYVKGNPLRWIDPFGLCNMDLQRLIQEATQGVINPNTGETITSGGGHCATTVRGYLNSAHGPLLSPLGSNGMPSDMAWGFDLISSGCYTVAEDGYVPQPGDIAITEGDGRSHISVNVAPNAWNADISTPNPVPSSGGAYTNAKPTIYRYSGDR